MSSSSCHLPSSSLLCQHLTQSLLVGGLLKPSMNHLSSVCPQLLWANGFSHVLQYFGSGSPRGSGEVASRPAASLTSAERSILVVCPVSSSGFPPSEPESSCGGHLQLLVDYSSFKNVSEISDGFDSTMGALCKWQLCKGKSPET